MPFRPVQWAKRSIEGRQTEADGSRLLNFYPVQLAAPEDSKVPVMLYSGPGFRRWLKTNGTDALASANDVGVHALLRINTPVYGTWLCGLTHQSVFFAVRIDPDSAGTYQIDADYDPFRSVSPDSIIEIPDSHTHPFTTETADAIPAASTRRLVTDGRRVLWVSRDEVFVWDFGKQDGAGFITINAPVAADLSVLEDLNDQDWVDCAWIDGYFLLAARTGQFFHSNYDSTDFDQLDFAEAGANPDPIVGMETLNRRIYLFGSETIETWFNAGGADFAFSRDNSATMEMGCAARDSIAKNVSYITFVGSDGIVYALSPRGPQRVSMESVEFDLARCSLELCRAYTYAEEGHYFYVLTLTFPDGTRKGWAYDFTTGWWHERSQTDVLCAIPWGRNRLLVGRQGAVHVFDQRLDWGLLEDDTTGAAPIYREAVAPRIFANLQRFNMRSFQVDLPRRSGGKKSDYVVIEWSDDAKVTWKGGTTSDMKPKRYLLDAGPRIRVNRLGQVREGRNMRLSTLAHRRVDVLGAYLETDVYFD